MVKAVSLSLILILLVGCTVRGGWPRFLRWGESPGWSGSKVDRSDFTTNEIEEMSSQIIKLKQQIKAEQ